MCNIYETLFNKIPPIRIIINIKYFLNCISLSLN